MTEASAGLRKALARGAGVSKLTHEELLAQMTDEQKAAMAAALAPTASAAAPAAAGDMPKKGGEDDDDADMEDGEKKSKSKKKDSDEYMEGDEAEAGAKAATQRAVAVMSSEHVAGRTKLAATLLANDKLSADEIISILSASAPAAPAPATGDDDDKARADMRAKLAAEQPEPTGQAAEEEPQADNSLVANMKARFGLKD